MTAEQILQALNELPRFYFRYVPDHTDLMVKIGAMEARVRWSHNKRGVIDVTCESELFHFKWDNLLKRWAVEKPADVSKC